MNPTKHTAALEVFAAQSIPDKERALFAHWNTFLDYMLPQPSDHENDRVEWVDNRFEVLYRAASQWLILDLMARVEALETPGATDRVDDHR